MSAFQERMREVAERLSPEAKQVVMQVLSAEHKRRFGNRDDLPESYATLALKVVKNRETGK